MNETLLSKEVLSFQDGDRDLLEIMEIGNIIRDLVASGEAELWNKSRELMVNVEILTSALRVAGLVPEDWTGPVGGHW